MLNRIKNPNGGRRVPIRWSERKWTTSLVFTQREDSQPYAQVTFKHETGYATTTSADIGNGFSFRPNIYFSIKARLSANKWTISQSMSV